MLKTYWQPRFSPRIAAALVAAFVLAAALSVWKKSTTWDEPFHLAGGIAQLQTGSPRLNVDHPPLARLLGALPSLVIETPVVLASDPAAWQRADLMTAPNAIFGTIEDQLLWPARLLMLTLAVLQGWLLYAWGTRLFGPERALLPLALFAFCPVLLANAPLVTTDMAVTTFMFAALYAWWRYLQAPSGVHLAWACLSVAAALSSKHTALLLAPIFMGLGIVAVTAPSVLGGHPLRRLKVVCGSLLIIGTAAVVGIDLAFFFDGVFLTPPELVAEAQHLPPSFIAVAERISHWWPAWLPMPLPFYYLIGALWAGAIVGMGHWTYFLGEPGTGGWPNFFVVLLLVKLSIPSLLLIGWGVSKACARLPREWWNLLFLVFPPLLLILIASTGSKQIGIRHIMPALPFLFLLAGYSLRDRLPRWKSVIVATLLVLNAIASLTVHPYYLMYFNFLGGGPERGWHVSVSGDAWGQGDADLVRWLQARRINSLAYLGDGWGPSVLRRANITLKPPPCEDTGELVAAHISRMMVTTTLDDARCYTWMRLKEPDEKIGYSIFLYNSKSARPSPPANLALFSQALNLQLQGNRDAAIPLYRAYLLQEPDYYQAHFNLGIALMETDQCPLAIPEFERTLELWPGYKEAHLHLARCYSAGGRVDKAQWHADESRK